MFGILVAVLIYSMLITTFIFIPVMFGLRTYISFKNNINLKDKLLIMFLPFSFGYYYYLPKQYKTKIYNKMMLLFLVFSVLGIMFTLFQIIIPSYT